MQQPHLSCLHGTFNPPGAAENIETSEDPNTFFLLSFIPFKKSLQNSNAPPSVPLVIYTQWPPLQPEPADKAKLFSSTSGELKVRLSSTSRQGDCRTTSVRLCCHWWAKFLPPNQGLQAAFGQTSRRPPGGRRYAGWVKVEVIVT